MQLEYTLCQFQAGQSSFARKTHRQLEGDPHLTVQCGPQVVRWELNNLVDGQPEVVQGSPRQDRVDFYFLLDTLRQEMGQFPHPNVQPNNALSLNPTNSQGTERPGGKQVRMIAPLHRYRVESVEVFVSHDAQAFHAIGRNAVLHVDIESTPARLYGQELLEVHFGIQASYAIKDYAGTVNYAVISMSPEAYATILHDLQAL